MSGPFYNIVSGSRIVSSDRSTDHSGSDDTAVTDWTIGTDFILCVHQEDNSKDTEAGTYKLQWRNVTDSGSFADLAATGELNYTVGGATDLTNGTACAPADWKCTDQGRTDVNGTEREDSNATVAFDGTDGDETEHQWAISTDSAVALKQYAFQFVDTANGDRTDAIGVTITMAAGSVQVSLDALSLPTTAATLTVVPVTTIGLNDISLPTSVAVLSVLPGEATIGLNDLSLPATTATLTVQTGITVSLNEISLPLSAVNLTAITDVVVILNDVPIPVSAINLSVVPGEATISLNDLSIPASAVTLTVVPGEATISLNELALNTTPVALSVVPGSATIGLNDVSIPATISSLSVVPGEVTISLSDLSAALNAASLLVVPGPAIIGLNAASAPLNAGAILVHFTIQLKALGFEEEGENIFVGIDDGSVYLKSGSVVIRL